MSTRSVLGGLLTAVALAAAVTGFAPIRPAAATEPSHVMSGVVLTSLGVPASGAEVQVDALTRGETAQEAVRVGTAVTDQAGNFTIVGFPQNPYAVADDHGRSYLQVRATSATEGVITGLEAVLPSSAGAVWTLPDTVEGSLSGVTLQLHNTITRSFAARPLTLGTPPAVGMTSMSTTASSVDSAESTEGAEGYTEFTSGTTSKPAGVEIPMPVQLPAALVAGGACPSNYVENWYKTNKFRTSYVPVQFASTGNKSTLQYQYDMTKNTDLEVTFVRDGDGWSGGITGSASETTGRQYTFDFANNVRKLAKLEWEYVRWDQYCVSSGPSPYYATGLVKWRPNRISSGSVKRNTSASFVCDDANVSNMSATTSVATSSRVRWGGWFAIAAGFRSDLVQENSSSEKLTFIPDPGAVARMCGSNAKPLDANRVKEIS